MAVEIRNENGDIAGYQLTGNPEIDARIKYEVERTEDKGRLSRMESHIEDLKLRTEKFEDKFDAFGTFFREWVQTISSKNLEHERKLNGDIGQKGIIDRLKCVESDNAKLKVSAGVIAWIVPISIAALGVFLKFWK